MHPDFQAPHLTLEQMRRLFAKQLIEPLEPQEIAALGGPLPAEPDIAWWEDRILRPAIGTGCSIPLLVRQRALHRLVAPRRYQVGQAYTDLACWAMGFGLLYSEFNKPDVPWSDPNRSAGGLAMLHLLNLVQHRMPVYFLAQALLTALQQTTPPADTRIGDLPWPHPAFIIQVPRRTFPIPPDGDQPGGHLTGVAGSRMTIQDGSRALVLSILLENANGTFWPYTQLVPLSGNLWEVMNQPERANAAAQTAFQTGLDVFLRAFLLMLARPDLVERERLERPEKRDRRGALTQEALWRPAFLGRTYAPAAPQGGTHASPRLHWRRGHYRRQLYGPELQREKIIWIEPMVVGGAPVSGATSERPAG